MRILPIDEDTVLLVQNMLNEAIATLNKKRNTRDYHGTANWAFTAVFTWGALEEFKGRDVKADVSRYNQFIINRLTDICGAHQLVRVKHSSMDDIYRKVGGEVLLAKMRKAREERKSPHSIGSYPTEGHEEVIEGLLESLMHPPQSRTPKRGRRKRHP